MAVKVTPPEPQMTRLRDLADHLASRGDAVCLTVSAIDRVVARLKTSASSCSAPDSSCTTQAERATSVFAVARRGSARRTAYFAARGIGPGAMVNATSRAAGQLGVRLGSVAAPVAAEVAAEGLGPEDGDDFTGEADAALSDVIHSLRLPPGLAIEVEASLVRERRVLVRDAAAARRTSSVAGALVIDYLADGKPVADRAVTWQGLKLPGADEITAALAEVADAGMRQAKARRNAKRAGDRVQLLLDGGPALVFLHEVCGHLLEHRWDRPSLMASRLGELVAYPGLTIADDPHLADGYGSYDITALGHDAVRRDLVRNGRLVGFLADTVDGPWRVDAPRFSPAPRMSNTVLVPEVPTATSADPVDHALGRARAPVARVRRLGYGSLNHMDGTFTLSVEEAQMEVSGRMADVLPFTVRGDAPDALAGIAAVGSPATVRRWSAFCLGTSGKVAVGGVGPALLTGPLRVTPARTDREAMAMRA